MNCDNLTMLCDFYELTMSNGYFKNGFYKRMTYFDVFFRNVPDNGGFAIAAGLEQVVDYIENLHFSKEDIDFLRSKKIFDEEFLDYLKDFRFTGDIYAVPEGTPVFPHEPILTVKAPAIEAQLIETYVLLAINHQSLIATKANRIVRASEGRTVLEFGSRRAQGADGAVIGARAAYIGGCAGTACTLTDEKYGVPAGGTMAHSWVQMFDTEYDAFKTYCEIYPENATLLVDTYNTLKSGIPNAIRAFKEVLLPKGITNCAIRLDSGDISYLSKKARKMLDEAGFENAKICVSGDLDETLINSLKMQGACINTWGVGTKLITSDDKPALGGVYKMSAEIIDGVVYPKIKLSENAVKITNPGIKTVYRLYDKDHMAIADLIALRDEKFDTTKPLTIYHPEQTYKRMTLTDYTMRELLVPIFIDGKQVYNCPTIQQIQAYAKQELDTLWEESKRLMNPQVYKVDYSDGLYDLRQKLIREHRKLPANA